MTLKKFNKIVEDSDNTSGVEEEEKKEDFFKTDDLKLEKERSNQMTPTPDKTTKQNLAAAFRKKNKSLSNIELDFNSINIS